MYRWTVFISAGLNEKFLVFLCPRRITVLINYPTKAFHSDRTGIRFHETEDGILIISENIKFELNGIQCTAHY